MARAAPPDAASMHRRAAVVALIVVVTEAAVASLVTLVPALASLGTTTLSSWALLAGPAVLTLVGLGVLVFSLGGPARPSAAALGIGLVAISLGAFMGALGVVTPSMRGAGLAFAAPLVVGEIFAAGAWLARPGAERLSTALSLVTAALTTCAAAFLTERLDVEMAPLAIGVTGVCAQLQLAMARVGEGAHAPGSLSVAVGARFASVPRSLVLAALGRSGPQGDA